jgi:hypothetical protein
MVFLTNRCSLGLHLRATLDGPVSHRVAFFAVHVPVM